MARRHGGPAFPALIPVEHSDAQGKDYPDYTESGMTLRDWFDGKALVGMLARGYRAPGEAARIAYDYADAMLAAREQTS